jgi:hypothetical protein
MDIASRRPRGAALLTAGASLLAVVIGGGVPASAEDATSVGGSYMSGTYTAQVPPLAIPPRQQLGRPAAPQRTRGALLRQGTVEERNVSQFEREREEYEPLGVRFAEQWLMYGAIEAGYEYNNNIFSTRNDKESDSILVAAPVVRIRSDLPQHQLNLDVGAAGARYLDNEDESFVDAFASANGRFDISDTLFAFARLGAAKEHEDRSSPNAAFGSEPTEYYRYDAFAGIASSGLRLGWQADLLYRRLDFDDTPRDGGAPIDQDFRDIDIVIGSARVNWEWAQGFETYVRGSYNVRDHFSAQRVVSGSIENRDSDGFEAVAGVRLSQPAVFLVDAFGGYMRQDYDDPRFDNISTAAFGLDGVFNITTRTSLVADVTRSIEETTLIGSPGLLQTIATAGVEQEIIDNLLGRVSVSRIWSDFEQSDRDDDVWVATAQLKYFLNRNVYLVPRAQYIDRTSDIEADEFDQVRVQLLVGAQF